MAGGAQNALQDPQVACHRSSLHRALKDGVDQPRELCNQAFCGKGGHVILLLYLECVMGQEPGAT